LRRPKLSTIKGSSAPGRRRYYNGFCKKWDGRAWLGLLWLRIGTGVRLL